MASSGEPWNEDQERTVEFDRVQLRADALDDLAESYLAANPGLTAGDPDEAWWEETARGMAYRRDDRDASPSGEPGTGVRPARAAWWERAVESGRGYRPAATEDAGAALDRPPEPRHPSEPIGSNSRAAPKPSSKPLRAPGWELEISLQRSPKPASAVKPERAPRPDPPAASDYSTGPIPLVSPERPIAPQPPAVPERPAPSGIPRDEPAPTRPAAQGRRGRIMVGAAALVTVLVAGSAVALALSSRHHDNAARTSHIKKATTPAARNQTAILAASDRAQAAIWITAQISHHVKVSCDPVMCQGLIHQGFPSDELVEVGRSSHYPLHSAVVVMTPALRHQFGAGFEARWAPVALAGFGGGGDSITVRVIAPQGASAYEAALAADVTQRIAVGTGLVSSSQISIAPASKRAIVAGLVDPRILSVIVALAAQHPINVLAFGKNFPGTTPGTPFRIAVFAEHVPAAGLSTSQYAAAMISLLRAQSAEYRPAKIMTVRLPSGRPGLEVQYPGPTPIGLLHH